MINSQAYKEWKDLFNENVSNVWQEESIPLLKKLSMMLFSLKEEIKRIQTDIDKDVSNLRKTVVETQSKQDVLLELECSGSNYGNKENIEINKTETKPSQSKTFSQNVTVNSPEIFHNAEVSLCGSNDSGSIINSDEDMANTLTSGSPEIKKKRRNYSFQKRLRQRHNLTDANTPTINFLKNLVSSHTADKISQHAENKKQTSSTDEKSSTDFFKELISFTQQPGDLVEIDLRYTPHKNEDNEATSKGQDMNLTPLRNDFDVDLSIVQCTPVPISLPKRKNKTSSYVLKKKSIREKNATLTQMFSKNRNIKEIQKKNRIQAVNYDSDETYFDPSQAEKTGEVSSQMGITRMVSYLNTDSRLKGKTDTLKENEGKKIINLDPVTQEIADISKDITHDYFGEDISLNSAIIEDDEDKGANVSQGLNEFLAKAQKNRLEKYPYSILGPT